MEDSDSETWISALVVLLGVAMILQSVWFDLVPAQSWNNAAVGALLIVVGGYNARRRTNERFGNVAAASFVALLGLWLVVASFVFGVEAGLTENVDTLWFWSGLFGGQFAFVLGADSAFQAHDQRRKHGAQHA